MASPNRSEAAPVKERDLNRGKHYEREAARFLRQAGLEILSHNFRCKLGEIDLICREAETLVFVEVRYRGNPHFASAAASVTPAKQRRLLRTVAFYLQQRGLTDRQACRLDVIALRPGHPKDEDAIQWLKNAITL
jgi:putative endonuclease